MSNRLDKFEGNGTVPETDSDQGSDIHDTHIPSASDTGGSGLSLLSNDSDFKRAMAEMEGVEVVDRDAAFCDRLIDFLQREIQFLVVDSDSGEETIEIVYDPNKPHKERS